MPCVLATAPAAEPLSTAEAKAFLRVDVSDDDTLITALVKAAREIIESWTGRAFISQTWDLYLDRFPWCIELRKAPVTAVTSIQYVDPAGTLQTLSPALYQVDLKSTPARIIPVYGQMWPVTRTQLNAVTVRFVAGSADANDLASAAQGPSMLQALRYLVKHFYDNRDTVVTGTIVTEVPKTLEWLVLPLKIW